MSPLSRGRAGRGRRRQPASRPATARTADAADPESGLDFEEATDCWFDEPIPGDRRSWAIPPAHGTYRGLDLERLNPHDEDELQPLIEAMHDGDEPSDEEEFSPGAHVAMHHAVARQILTDDPPNTWQTVQRLAGLGYDWHNIMHMIAALVAQDVQAILVEHRQPDPQDYARRLDELPGDWPPPDALH